VRVQLPIGLATQRVRGPGGCSSRSGRHPPRQRRQHQPRSRLVGKETPHAPSCLFALSSVRAREGQGGAVVLRGRPQGGAVDSSRSSISGGAPPHPCPPRARTRGDGKHLAGSRGLPSNGERSGCSNIRGDAPAARPHARQWVRARGFGGRRPGLDRKGDSAGAKLLVCPLQRPRWGGSGWGRPPSRSSISGGAPPHPLPSPREDARSGQTFGGQPWPASYATVSAPWLLNIRGDAPAAPPTR
jgi:hypothetical protein